MNTYDAENSEQLKAEGMTKAAQSRKADLEWVRGHIAEPIATCHPDRECTADDVSEELQRRGMGSSYLGPAAGALFKTPAWEWTGRYVPSRKDTNHARMLRVWRFNGSSD